MDGELHDFFCSKYGLVVYTARRYAPDPFLVPDIVQQVFLEFIKDAKRKNWVLLNDGNPLLYRITKNVARKYWRQHQHGRPEEIQKIGEFLLQNNAKQVMPEELPPGEWEIPNEIEALNACLEKLTPKNRRLIDMKYFLETPTDEIAEMFHVKPNSIHRAIARIRMQLADCISHRLGAKTQ